MRNRKKRKSSCRFNWPETQPANTFYQQNLLLPAIPCIVRSQYEADISIFLIATGILAILLLLLIYRTIALRKKVESKTAEVNSKVTELLQKDQELQKEQLLYLNLFENAQEGIITYHEREFIACNQRLCDFFGRPRKDFKSNLLFFFSPIIQPCGLDSITKGMQIANRSMNGEKQQFEWLFIKKSGELFYADVTVTPFQYLGTTYSTVVIRDVSERKRVEEELNKYKQMLEMLVAQKTEELKLANSQLETNNEELVATNELLKGTINQLNTEIYLKELAQKEQEKNQEILDRFINQSTDGICIVDPKGYIVYWNSIQEELFGIPASKANQKHYKAVAQVFKNNSSPFDYNSIKKSIARYKERGIAVMVKFTSTQEDAVAKHFEATLFPIHTSSGVYSGLITRDLTQQKIAEQSNEIYSKQIEELLAINTQRNLELTDQLSAIFKNSNVQVAFFLPVGDSFEFISYSNSWYPFSKEGQRSLNKLKIEDVYKDQTLILMESLLKECQNTNREVSREVEWTHNNRKHYLNFMLWKINRGETPDLQQIICFYFDNTEKRELELALSKREMHLNNAQSIANIGSWEWELSSQMVSCSNELFNIFEIENQHGQIPLSSIYKALPANETRDFIVKLKSCIKAKKSHCQSIYNIRCSRGTLKTLQVSVYITYKGEHPVLAEGTVQDITQQQQLKQSIIENEEKFRLIFDNTLDTISLIDINTCTYIDINKHFLKVTGLTREMVIGKTRDDINVWHSITERDAYQNLIEKRGRVENFNITWNVKGGPRNFLLSSEVISINGKKLLLSISKDITQIHQITLALQESEEKFRTIFNSTNDGILVSTTNFTFIDANTALFKLLGYSKEELNGADMLDFVPKKYHNLLWNNKINVARNGRIPIVEFEVITKSKAKIPVEVSIASKVFNGKLHVISVVKDISYRKKAEERLLAATFEAEEGERRKLASDLHDDVGPLLSSMNMYLSLLARKEEVKPFHELIDSLTGILKETTATVRSISRNISPHTLTRYGLLAALNSFWTDKKNFYHIDIVENLGSKRLPQLVELMIYRILMEAFCNTAKHANASSIQIFISLTSKELKVRYSDNGQGFNYQQYKEKASTGLGLASIANRVQVIGGTYSIKSEPNKGFTLDISVPLNATS